MEGELGEVGCAAASALRSGRALGYQPESVRNVVELCQRRNLHLPHEVATMHLHRRLGDAHVTRNLFVTTALGDLNHDPALAEGQYFEAGPERTQCFVPLASETVTSKPEIDRIEQVLVTKRLREELDSTALHRLHAHRNVPMPGDEDDRKLDLCRREVALKIQPAAARQSHIENEAGWAIRRFESAIIGNRRKELWSQADGS